MAESGDLDYRVRLRTALPFRRPFRSFLRAGEVDVLRSMSSGGLALALAAAPVATEAKVPMIVMAAATAMIPTRSPFIVRTSFTLPQAAVVADADHVRPDVGERQARGGDAADPRLRDRHLLFDVQPEAGRPARREAPP